MKPMLSATMDNLERIKFPVLCSPKLDGIRCLMVGRVPVSRNLKHIPNASIFKELRSLMLPELDGELIVGKPTADDCYRKTNSGVMSHEDEPDWTYHLFDLYENGPFTARLDNVKRVLQRLSHRRLRMVKHVTCRSVEEVLAFEAKCLTEGYEGIMGRSPHGLYKQGRSTLNEGGLWKLKRFVTREARITGFQEQMRNDNVKTRDELGRAKRSSHKANLTPKGTLGAVEAVDVESGVKFDCGTGFDDFERQKIWENQSDYLGKVFTYKSLPIGVKDKPRFPVWLGLRKDL